MDDEDIDVMVVLLHELSWRRRATSLSVHEGVEEDKTLEKDLAGACRKSGGNGRPGGRREEQGQKCLRVAKIFGVTNF